MTRKGSQVQSLHRAQIFIFLALYRIMVCDARVAPMSAGWRSTGSRPEGVGTQWVARMRV